VEVVVVNNIILFKAVKEVGEGKLQTHIAYHKNLITQLTGIVRNRNSQKSGRPSSSVTMERLNGRLHFIVQKESMSTKDYMVCSNRQVKGGRWETSFYCKTCQRKPGLHPGSCFKKYHTLKNYN
jgi:hypothetical protein